MKKITKMTLCLLTAGSLFATQALAEEGAGPEEDLNERVTALEERLKDAWTDKITLSGALEAEAGYEKIDIKDDAADDETSSDLVLATASLGVEARINDNISGTAILLWEEDDTEPIDLDEGYILVEGGDSTPLYLKTGKIYVPFGNFESNMVSDPLTLELGETRESALELGINAGGFYGAIYAFNGDIDIEGDDDVIDNFGVNAGFALENDNMSFDIGAGWVNNIYDSDGMSGMLEDSIAEAEENGFIASLKERVPGMSAHAILSTGPFTLIGEYTAMLDDTTAVLADIETGTLDALGLGNESKADGLKAWNLEAGYGFELAGREAVLGVAYQGVSNAEEALPEKRYLGVIGVGVTENTSLALEYRHDEYETGDKADAVTMQFAIEF